MMDIVPIPQRFENAIGKTRDQEILNGFLSQVMIDAIDIFFIEILFKTKLQTYCNWSLGEYLRN